MGFLGPRDDQWWADALETRISVNFAEWGLDDPEAIAAVQRILAHDMQVFPRHETVLNLLMRFFEGTSERGDFTRFLDDIQAVGIDTVISGLDTYYRSIVRIRVVAGVGSMKDVAIFLEPVVRLCIEWLKNFKIESSELAFSDAFHFLVLTEISRFRAQIGMEQPVAIPADASSDVVLSGEEASAQRKVKDSLADAKLTNLRKEVLMIGDVVEVGGVRFVVEQILSVGSSGGEQQAGIVANVYRVKAGDGRDGVLRVPGSKFFNRKVGRVSKSLEGLSVIDFAAFVIKFKRQFFGSDLTPVSMLSSSNWSEEDVRRAWPVSCDLWPELKDMIPVGDVPTFVHGLLGYFLSITDEYHVKAVFREELFRLGASDEIIPKDLACDLETGVFVEELCVGLNSCDLVYEQEYSLLDVNTLKAHLKSIAGLYRAAIKLGYSCVDRTAQDFIFSEDRPVKAIDWNVMRPRLYATSDAYKSEDRYQKEVGLLFMTLQTLLSVAEKVTGDEQITRCLNQINLSVNLDPSARVYELQDPNDLARGFSMQHVRRDEKSWSDPETLDGILTAMEEFAS